MLIKINWKFLIALNGSFDVVLNDEEDYSKQTNTGILIPTGIWRELHNFSSGSVCLALASAVFDEDDYIRDFDEFCFII